MTTFTAQMKQLARLVAGAKRDAPVRCLHGSAAKPFLAEGTVFVGQHFWWGHLVSCTARDGYTLTIASWERGEGKWYDSQGNVTGQQIVSG